MVQRRLCLEREDASHLAGVGASANKKSSYWIPQAKLVENSTKVPKKEVQNNKSQLPIDSEQHDRKSPCQGRG